MSTPGESPPACGWPQALRTHHLLEVPVVGPLGDCDSVAGSAAEQP